jgi:PAS domain S-box-containing protein
LLKDKCHCVTLQQIVAVVAVCINRRGSEEPSMQAALQELLASREGVEATFWQTVVDAMDEALIVVDPNRRIRYANRKAESLIGMTRAEARGKPCTEAISCPQCACVCRLFDDGRLDGMPVTVFDPVTGERRVFRKQGRLLCADDGTVIGGIETFSDVTAETEERGDKEKRIEQLFAEKKRSEALLDSLSEGVASVDANLQVRDFSRRMEEITGFERGEAMGRNILQLLDVASTVDPPEQRTTGATPPVRVDIRTRAGALRPVELWFRPVRFVEDELLVLVRDSAVAREPDAANEQRHGLHGLITRSPAMRPVLSLIESVATSDVNVLVEGDSGTGKELVARAIHRTSARAGAPFYAVNCATFSGSLLLSELFGHERGAFTGAVARKRGKLELAGNGTLFLDEVSEIPFEHQALLLRVLEERTFERVGGQASIDMDARIIAATNQRLDQAVASRRFREDLYYRLRVVPIHIPALRERPEDIELLLSYFLRQSSVSAGCTPPSVDPDVIDAFRAYAWPGNVRELRNVVEYLCCVGDGRITRADLPADFGNGIGATQRQVVVPQFDERERIFAALEKAHFHRTHAAELLGMDRSTLWRKMRKHGIRP